MEILGGGGAILLPPAGRRSRRGAQSSSVGTDLGGLDHRRHLRTRAGDAVRPAPLDRPARLAGASSASTAAAAEPLQRRARAGPERRPDGGRPVVGAACRRTRVHGARAFLGRDAAQPPRRADQGRGRRRRRPRRLRDALQGADGVRRRRPVPARVLRRIARWRTVRRGLHRRPAAVATSTASTQSAASTTRWCSPRPIPPTRTARRCRGPRWPTRRAPAGPQGRGAGRARRRRADVVPRARRTVAAELHRRPRGAHRGGGRAGRPGRAPGGCSRSWSRRSTAWPCWSRGPTASGPQCRTR